MLPYLGPGMSPIRLYLRGEQATMDEIIADLRDAAAEAQRRIIKLENKFGIGAKVERAQLAIIKRELHAVQQELWRSVGKRVRGGGTRVAEAAAIAEQQIEQVLFRALGENVPEVLLEAQSQYAKATVNSYLARGENGIGLSERVYKTRQLANGLVDRAINREVLLGRSWRKLAEAVVPMVHPDTPGGVSYAAKRLARTELNNAFHTTNIALAEANPWVTGQKWNLSRSHPRRDKCDDLAEGSSKGKPRGVYEKGHVPSKPHPQCLCYLTEEVVSEDQFLDSLASTTPEDVARSYGKAARTA